MIHSDWRNLFRFVYWFCQCYFNFMRLLGPDVSNKKKNMGCLAGNG
jgi:hypothetical protein